MCVSDISKFACLLADLLTGNDSHYRVVVTIAELLLSLPEKTAIKSSAYYDDVFLCLRVGRCCFKFNQCCKHLNKLNSIK